jgi:para-nitrobenzyl esterase
MNAISQAEKDRAGQGARVHVLLTYNTPILDGRYRAFHTAELPLVLRLVRYPNSENLSKPLAGAWAAFARTGNPNHKGLPTWPAYTTDERATMVFGEKIGLVKDPDREARLKFKSLPPNNRELAVAPENRSSCAAPSAPALSAAGVSGFCPWRFWAGGPRR